MSESIGVKLSRIGNEIDDREKRIEALKLSIELKRSENSCLLQSMPSDVVVAQCQYDEFKTKLRIETIKVDIEKEAKIQERLQHEILTYWKLYEEESQNISKIIFELSAEQFKVEQRDRIASDMFNKHYETYVMSCEELRSAVFEAELNSIGQSQDSTATSWKRKVLHALEVEAREVQQELNNVIQETQSLIEKMVADH